MTRALLAAIPALAIVVAVGIAVLLPQPGGVDAQSHSATRSFPAGWAAPGSEVQVTIATSNLGGFGQVEETLPEGFTYVRSSLDAFQVSVTGQTVLFTLIGSGSFTYVVGAPAMEGQYTFAGIVRNEDAVEQTIAGHTSLRIGPEPTPTPTPSRRRPPRLPPPHRPRRHRRPRPRLRQHRRPHRPHRRLRLRRQRQLRRRRCPHCHRRRHPRLTPRQRHRPQPCRHPRRRPRRSLLLSCRKSRTRVRPFRAGFPCSLSAWRCWPSSAAWSRSAAARRQLAGH